MVTLSASLASVSASGQGLLLLGDQLALGRSTVIDYNGVPRSRKGAQACRGSAEAGYREFWRPGLVLLCLPALSPTAGMEVM